MHLFAIEAFAIVIARWMQTRRIAQAKARGDVDHHGVFQKDKLGVPIYGGILSGHGWGYVTVGDVSFVMGTTGDVVLSYFYLFEEDFFEQCVAAITFASLWLLAALIYLSVAGMDYPKFRQIMREASQGQGQNSHNPRRRGYYTYSTLIEV